MDTLNQNTPNTKEICIENCQETCFADIFDIEEIQHMQDLFADAHGVASLITDVNGNPITKPSNFCFFCENIIRKTELGCINCFKSDALIGNYNPNGANVKQCHSGGLWDAGASISVGGKHIANWLVGQVRNEDIDINKVMQYADEIGTNREAYMEAFYKVPVMSVEKFTKIANLLFYIANELSEKGFSNLLLKNEIAQNEIAHKLLKDSEMRFSKILQDIKTVPVQGYSSDGTTQYWNKASELLYGYTAEEAIGKNIIDLIILPEMHTDIKLAMEEMAKSGEPSPASELVLKCKDGSLVTVFANHTIVKITGQPQEFFCFDIDLSEMKKAEEALIKKNKDLDYMNKFIVNREVRMAEMKKEVNELLEKLGEKKRYL